MSTTPRTDAAYYVVRNLDGIDHNMVKADFARELERELNTARDLHTNAIHLLNEETLKRIKLRDALLKCFEHGKKEIRRMTLNESAATGTQTNQAMIAEVLDADSKP